MRAMTTQQALSIVGRLASRFPGWQATEETAADWASKLVKFPADVTWRVVDRLTSTSAERWPPPLGEIRRAILTEMERAKPAALPEPVLSREEFRVRMNELKAALEGKTGPLVETLKGMES